MGSMTARLATAFAKYYVRSAGGRRAAIRGHTSGLFVTHAQGFGTRTSRGEKNLVDRRRYPPSAIKGALAFEQRSRGLKQVSRGRGRNAGRDMFDDDHAVGHGGRYRWLVSTCIAGTIGAFAIFVVIAGSTDRKNGEGFMPALERLREGASTPEFTPRMKRSAGLTWAVPKTDKLEVSRGLTSTRYVIHETIRQRRDERTYIQAKPYLRIVARLAPVPSSYQDVVPPFNPLQLYADNDPVGSSKGAGRAEREDVKITIVELVGGVLPREDGQRLDDRDADDVVRRFLIDEALAEAELSNAQAPVGAGQTDPDEKAFTSVIEKNNFEDDLIANPFPGQRQARVKVATGDTMERILQRNGANQWSASEMSRVMRSRFSGSDLRVGQELLIELAPSENESGRMEPTGFSLFNEAGEMVVTVKQAEDGSFAISETPIRDYAALRGLIEEKVSGARSSSLYASVYHSSLLQKVPSETVMQILRVHAYQTDFGRRIRPGDTIELFFDFDSNDFTEGAPDELLFTKITAGGETSRFYRFRTSDGEVDFYDDQGNNSKRFLTRKPVRGSNVRLSSGFGMRYHPLLNRRRMHSGVDWAGPTGTPILAAGRGVIEHAGRKGQYGNYVAIRHANGYKTAYAHMHRFARGVKTGAKVRQGQIIGYIGSTGLSSGPHLHYEVMVNSRKVDPMKIKVPQERQLKGRELAEFQREKARIDELMRRAPVMTINR